MGNYLSCCFSVSHSNIEWNYFTRYLNVSCILIYDKLMQLYDNLILVKFWGILTLVYSWTKNNGTQNIRLDKLSTNTLSIFQHSHLTSHKHCSSKLCAWESFPSNSYSSLDCQESRRLRAILKYRCNATNSRSFIFYDYLHSNRIKPCDTAPHQKTTSIRKNE